MTAIACIPATQQLRLVAEAPDDLVTFVAPGHRGSPTRSTCGKTVKSAAYGHRRTDGFLHLRLLRLSCDRFECSVCFAKWAEGQARRILEGLRPDSATLTKNGRAPAMLTRIQIVLNGPCARLSAEDLQLLPRRVTGLLKICGVRRAAWWLHAEPAQAGFDTIIDLCPPELHIEIVTTDPADANALRSATWRYGFVAPVRRFEVFRDRLEDRLLDLLLRSSRPLVKVGARTKAGHVVHRVGTRRSRGGIRASGRVDALTSKAKQPRSCSRCGEAVPAAEWAYFRPVDGSGRPAEVPWEDNEIHEVHDEPDGVHWERLDPWAVRVDG